ncbi:hypothetical protein TUM4641_32940 [Shewanella morhuae]|nr:hypothetical protein TUM4641_32940 [Shewanella morhuae]
MVIANAEYEITITERFDENLDQPDILYPAQIQEERAPIKGKANKYHGIRALKPKY